MLVLAGNQMSFTGVALPFPHAVARGTKFGPADPKHTS